MMTRNMNNIYLIFLYEMDKTTDQLLLTDDCIESFHEDFKKLFKTYFDKLMKYEYKFIDYYNKIIDTELTILIRKIKRRIMISKIPNFALSREKFIEHLLIKEIITLLQDYKKYE